MKPAPPQTDDWGITSRYKDADGTWHNLSATTRSAIRQAMGPLKPDFGGRPAPGLRLLKVGETVALTEPGELTLEDGSTLETARELPRDLPVGYHAFKTLKGEHLTRLIVSPGECYLPEDLKEWGWAVQLYALRSKKSWGMGDLEDLKKFGEWAGRELGCRFILANPLGAAVPAPPQQTSPYFPSSRRFWNPLYLRVEDVPGAVELKLDLDKIAAAGRALNQERVIDRDAIFELKQKALEAIWKRFRANREFDQFCQTKGRALEEFATFCALAEHFKSGWRSWPQSFRRPEGPSVRAFAKRHRDRIRFHQWLQWLLENQLTAAARALPVMQNLPIGVDPAGADAWIWQDLLAERMTIGAPADAFNTQGQAWGLPPFIPHRLRETGYAPFRQTIRAALQLKGGLRIDHVMGLFRLFWIPEGAAPREGAFVHYRHEELLAILAIESQRAKGIVVGEDLGTVAPGVRAALRQRKILSYRLLWFESKHPRNFPRQALAAVTTHDLFTVAGLWNGSDVIEQKKLGLQPNESGTRQILKRLRRRLQLRPQSKAAEAVVKTYRLLATAPSMLLTAALDDALAVEERPNMPGTTAGWPNWSLALPLPLEEIQKNLLVKEVAKACHRRNPKLSATASGHG
jgi:4-alpha-glucanotransferase